MKKSEKKKLTIYPHPRALTILGEQTPDCNYALEAFADLIRKATTELTLSREEWAYCADVLNGTMIDTSFSAQQSLMSSFRDAASLEATDRKWGVSADGLCAKIQSEIHAWAIIFACRFFWDNHERIDLLKDPWWNIAFRMDFEDLVVVRRYLDDAALAQSQHLPGDPVEQRWFTGLLRDGRRYRGYILLDGKSDAIEFWEETPAGDRGETLFRH